MWADPRVVRYIGGKPSTRAESWSRLARYVGLWSLLGFGYWAVEDKATGAYVGDVGFMDALRDIEPSIAGLPEAGWVLSPAFHGRGYAREALAAALDWCDGTLPPTRIAALIACDHVRSMRLGRAFGFTTTHTIDFGGVPTHVLFRERAAPQ